MLRRPAVRLFLCGAAALFWELVLIRWLGSCVRVVAYFTNFVLISSFFGLGAGALLVRRPFHAWRWLVAALCAAVLLGPLLGGLHAYNPASPGEFIWIGTPKAVLPDAFAAQGDGGVPYWLVLALVYAANTCVFLIFGQWLGRLFQAFPPLKAYSIEIGGSILGILLFAVQSKLRLPPPVWFGTGFLLVLGALDLPRRDKLKQAAYAALITLGIVPFSNHFIWSSYYKIRLSPLNEIFDAEKNDFTAFERPLGAQISVNNDYHQMILDLREDAGDHPFQKSWRWLYDYPHQPVPGLPDGPTLIVGAGSGNDVSAAVRARVAEIDAVEIDPAIVALGREHHPERPYAGSSVRVVVDDARSFLVRTDKRYAKIVFGFLDSHTLMSSFSSLRLDNFVYTREAMERARDRLLPGGRVYLTFASNTRWMHERLLKLLDGVFDYKTVFATEPSHGYANGVVYVNGKALDGPAPAPAAGAADAGPRVPTDDWPFLYLQEASLPGHYRVFIAMVLAMGAGSLALLPKGRRRLELPYFFLGAGFFLIETSNVVSLSLLYGSTWTVNAAVFTGILVLVLLGNLACSLKFKPDLDLLFFLLLASVYLAYRTPVSSLLRVEDPFLQAASASAVFLGPVFLASLIFGRLIQREKNLYEAYGSNLLGAVVGGSCEYLSMLLGLKKLLLVTLAFYACAYAFVRLDRGLSRD